MFREAIASGSELGRQVEPLLAEGKLVPDEVTTALIRERLADDDAQDGFVLDGFPRNLAQAEALDTMLEDIERPLSIILLLDLDDEVARARLGRRAELEGRADDTAAAIEERLGTYHRETEPVVEHYRSTGNLVQMHGDRSIDEVWSEVSKALDQLQARA
jgi:adenylate kinase